MESEAGFTWMTYQEAAAKLGVAVGSVQRRAFRSKWRRVPGNDGKARIGVPHDVLAAATAQSPSGHDMSGDVLGKTANDNDLASRLLDRLEALEARLVTHDAAEAARTAEVATLRETLARTEGELEGMRRASDQSRREVIEAEARAALARKAEEEAKASLARIRGRGLLSRILNHDH